MFPTDIDDGDDWIILIWRAIHGGKKQDTQKKRKTLCSRTPGLQEKHYTRAVNELIYQGWIDGGITVTFLSVSKYVIPIIPRKG